MRKVSIILVALFFAISSEAQFNQDWGLILGVGTHLGDINKAAGQNPLGASKANPTFGAYYRYKFSSLFSARGQVQWGRISGADKNADDPPRIARNLSFRTDLIEFAGIGEFHAIDIKDFGRTGRYNVFFNLYGFLGVAMTYYDPMAQRDNGEWVKLRPLQTEGQSYSMFTPAFPIGIGSHFTFNRKWRIGAELGYRFTLTDYLDDVSGEYLTWEEYEKGDPLTYEMAVRTDYDYINSRPDLFPDGYASPSGGRSAGIRGSSEVKDSYFWGTVNVGMMIRGKSNFYKARYQFTRGRKHKKRRARAKF
jgi:hypothetical protein